ncbi:tail fiber protein [Brassicibacter mesophilus]|uniref:tail fiber protein n=1 Tax=Brassicibacter mesophilus TaxID=745119 RepID=UPI003D262031
MPEKSSFFNHIEGDRVYNADDFADYFNSVLTDGIFNGGENLSVYYGGTDRKARIKSGKAWIKGYFYHNTDDSLILEHDEADGTYDRIDRIVLRLDKNPESRHIKAFIKKGVPSVNPVAQELTRDDMTYEISLAQVLVVHNITTIAPSNVTDERYDANVCGLVNSLIQVDTAAMQQQFEDFISSLDEQMFETKDGAQNKADTAEANAKKYTDSEISGISTLMAELEQNKVDKTAISDSVTSTNSTTVASSKAVKTAYDKGNHAHPYAPSSHVGAGGTAHTVVTTSANGFMSAADKSKLNGIEAGAKGDQTAGEILTLLKTVDGSGSGLDADLLDGKHASDFVLNSNVGYVTGIYTGDGQATRIINLGFTPSAVLLFNANGKTTYYNSDYNGGLVINGYPVVKDGAQPTVVFEIVTGGFKIYFDSSLSIFTNNNKTSSNPYRYIAFK